MSIECGLPTVWDVLKGAYNLLKDPVVYAMSSKSFFDSLKMEAEQLENEVRRVNDLAQEARNNLRKPNEVFKEWKKGADKASEDARIRWEAFEDSKSCCYGRLPNPYCHYKFSTDAESKIKDIQKLAKESARFRRVDDLSAAASNLSASMSVKLGDHGVFESRALMIRNIMDALANNSNSVVGVYGMGGVGKSTLLEDVKRILIEERSFHWVAKADVSNNPNIHTIQGDIADALNLTSIKDKETISARAELLHERLKMEEKEKKKVLIILDNLWEPLDLKSVGIPCTPDNKAIGCKLLLTSRDQHLLQREMGCEQESLFLLGGLEEEEARGLFERLVGDKVHDDDFKPWAEIALDRCAGMPFLIVAMAKRFKTAELFEWEDALRNMEKFNHEEINRLIDDMLKWSYDKLKDEAKALLRLCVVCGVSTPSLENLLRYGVGLGLFQQVSSMEDARKRLRRHIRDLQASSLLLDSEDVDGFKIHDLVCEFVASVSSRDYPILILKDKVKSVTESLDDKLKSCEAMCFSDMKELPQELHCPELRIFLLFTNDESLQIPDSYFNSMGRLAVLSLTNVHLTRSLTSFQFLANLHTLCLDDCTLDDVAILGVLKGLQILSFARSKIQRLPKEIGQLVELKSLDLSCCSRLEIIEPGVLGRLTKLEELYMDDSFERWSAGEQTPPTNACLIELNDVKNLRTLHVTIPDPSVLPKDLNFKQLTKFRIIIGYSWWKSWYFAAEDNGSMKLVLNLDSTSDVLQKECMQSILCKTDDLFLDKLNGAEQSFSVLLHEGSGFPQLKHLHVEYSPSVHYILERPSFHAFKTLETLRLRNLINLEKICHNYVSAESFRTLKVVEVTTCEKIEVLFPRSFLRELPQLEEIKVSNCELMRGIVEADDDRGILELPNLRVLNMYGLPNMESFFASRSSPSTSTLDDQIGTQIVFLNGEQIAFPSLEALEVDGLDNPRFMFSPSMVKSLKKLRELSISHCKKMEAIIMGDEGLGVEISKTLSFPKLTDLCLEGLESLTCFSCEKCSREGQSQAHIQSLANVLFNGEVDFPKLETLNIMGLDNFKVIFYPSMIKSLAELRQLSISKCYNVEVIIAEEEGSGMETSETLAFSMLTDLELNELENLTCFSRGKVTREDRSHGSIHSRFNVLFNREVAFPSLENLYIKCIGYIEKIWDSQVAADSFHNLKSFCVDGCSKLVNLVPSCIIGELSSLESLEAQNCGSLEVVFELQPTKATNLVKLTELRISKCRMLREVFSDEGGRRSNVVALSQLKYIALNGLIRLRCFYSGGYTLMLPLLEDVIVTGCLNMEVFSHGPIVASKLERVQVSNKVWFWKENLNVTIQNMLEEMSTIVGVKNKLLSELPEVIGKWHNEPYPMDHSREVESLTVDKCSSFINAIPSRLMLVLENMKILQVRDCESLEEIFDLEGLEGEESIGVLPSIQILDLVNLPKLKRLWNKDLQGLLPYDFLSYITLYKCSRLRHAFTTSMARCLANLRCMEIKECGQMEGVIPEEEGQGSAMEKIAFPKLKRLKLECLPNLTSFLLGKNHMLECPKLKELIVAHCPKMRSLVWQSLMEIDDGTPSLFTPQVQFPHLESMVLSHMDNLSKIWTIGPRETLTFDNLWEVEVQNCKSLENIFPHWVATSSIQLKKLQVESCGIEEIVANGDHPHSNTAQVLFPNLTSLLLHDMPRLKTFCPKSPTLNWPFLEELRVTHCDKVNISCFAASLNKWTQRNDQQDLSDQEAHSAFEWDFLNLERLLLFDKDIQMIQNGKHNDDIFGKPKALTLACFHDEKAIFPPRYVLERFQSLESLEVFCGSFEDIFPDDGIVDEERNSVLESLRKLKLSKLHKLKHVWREDCLVSKILRSIKTLEVWDCPGLTTLFPAMKSFLNLTELVVKNSSGLVHLGTTSAFKSLVHLTTMTIIECDRMKKVMASNKNGGIISLEKLGMLRLQNMPSLECFSSITGCFLLLPSLEYIEVEECPKMKIFSKGHSLSTPRLHSASLFRYKWKWNWEGDLTNSEDDLNTVIQKLSA